MILADVAFLTQKRHDSPRALPSLKPFNEGSDKHGWFPLLKPSTS
jgi:hypothetical protein